jgi:hypothetical protein
MYLILRPGSPQIASIWECHHPTNVHAVPLVGKLTINRRAMIPLALIDYFKQHHAFLCDSILNLDCALNEACQAHCW